MTRALETLSRILCRWSGHRWTYGDWGPCERPYCYTGRSGPALPD